MWAGGPLPLFITMNIIMIMNKIISIVNSLTRQIEILRNRNWTRLLGISNWRFFSASLTLWIVGLFFTPRIYSNTTSVDTDVCKLDRIIEFFFNWVLTRHLSNIDYWYVLPARWNISILKLWTTWKRHFWVLVMLGEQWWSYPSHSTSQIVQNRRSHHWLGVHDPQHCPVHLL